MSAAVQPLMAPNEADMYAHIEHLFGGYLEGWQDGKIELAWTDPDPDESGRYKLKHSELFELDGASIDRLVAKAIEVNSRPRTNVYIGATLRHPHTAPFGRTNDGDFYVATGYWTDLDDKDANDQASRRFEAARPSLVVRTGEYPHWRHQVWWRLAEPVSDPNRVRAAVSGLSAALGGDGTVSNPSRVMRLAGGIAWDQKPGRRPEVTRIIELKTPGLKAYLPEHIERVYPPLFSLDHARAAKTAPGPNLGVVRGTSVLGLPTGKVVDGRERYMVNVICARLIDYCGQFGAEPTPDELFEHAWDVYEREVDLSRGGRGKSEFMDKCRSTMRRFQQGRIRGAENLDAAVASYRTRREAKRENVRHESTTDEAFDERVSEAHADGVFEFLDVRAIKTLPDPKWLVTGLVTEQALGFIFGPPGSGKSFVALSMALSLSVGMPDWWGREIERAGAVVYVSSEGQADLKFRIAAWEQYNNMLADDAPFYLIRQTINFMNPDDVAKLVATVEAVKAVAATEIVAVYVDTVSRVLPGADENLQKDMTLFVAACDAVRQRFGATVIGVHHTSRNGNLRGSTVFDGAGDFLAQIEREEGAKTGTLTARKIKAAEDGWSESFGLPVIELPFGKTSLVAAKEAAQSDDPKPGEWPDRNTCRRILGAVQSAWNTGIPWSPKHQTMKEGRFAPRLIQAQFGVSAEVAETMVQTWLDNGVLAFDMADKKTKRMGLRVSGGID